MKTVTAQSHAIIAGPARALVAAALALAAAGCRGEDATARVGHARFAVEVAASEAERERGLMYRAELAEGHGMLFVMPRPQHAAFWMKNTHVALDILYFDAHGRLAEIVPDVPPCATDPCPIYPSTGPVRYVLELPAGSAARHGLKRGDRLKPPAGY